jgi:hypothetical protein
MVIAEGKFNFFKTSPPRVNYAGPYDLLSITHYSPFAFGRKPGFQTIFPNDKIKGAKMGQRKALSKVILQVRSTSKGFRSNGMSYLMDGATPSSFMG